MRSRPATWTALFSRNVLSPISTHEAWGSSSLTCAPKNARKRCHSADTICEVKFANRSAALRWPAASPAVCGGLCEEAATPGQPVSRQSAFWRTLPAIHPRELPGTAGSAAMLRQGMQNISLDVSNVLLRRLRFKQKSASLCAESVDGRNSLWKALEKWSEIGPLIFCCCAVAAKFLSRESG